jgi:hypothetical protein
MTLIEERRLSKIRQKIRADRRQLESGQLKINLSSGCYQVNTKHYCNKFSFPQNILIEEIGWEAYEWQKR